MLPLCYTALLLPYMIFVNMTYRFFENFLPGEDVRLVATLAIDQDAVDVRWTDGLDHPGVEVTLELDQDSEPLREI